jgi:hypothetical protein
MVFLNRVGKVFIDHGLLRERNGENSVPNLDFGFSHYWQRAESIRSIMASTLSYLRS